MRSSLGVRKRLGETTFVDHIRRAATQGKDTGFNSDHPPTLWNCPLLPDPHQEGSERCKQKVSPLIRNRINPAESSHREIQDNLI
jgi:hypothetical protein